jgi:hypothetical protein
MKNRIILSFLTGCLLTGFAFWVFIGSPGAVEAQKNHLTLEFPGYHHLNYVSSWVVRNELWHDYMLPKDAQAAG